MLSTISVFPGRRPVYRSRLLDALITLFAGLGLFFVGIKLLGAEMAQLTGRRVRRWIARSTGSYPQAALVGLAGGVVTQSTNAITVILMSLASADLITPRQARPVLAWANIGTAALVLIASIDLHLFVLTLIGLIGFCFYLNLDRSKRLRPIVSAMLGLGLLFLGLEVMRDGAHALAALSLVVEIFRFATGSAVLAFIAGGALAMMTQSSATVSILAIAMGGAGLLELEQAMLLVYGASVGSGLGTYLVAAQTAGTPRQLAIYQTFIKCAGVALLLPALILEEFGHLPMLAAGVRHVATAPGLRIGLVYLACQVAAVLVAGLLEGVIQPVLARLSPPSATESLSRPRYIYEQALAEPATALILVEREQARIFALLPLHLGIADALSGEATQPAAAAAKPSATALIAAVGEFLADLAGTGADHETLEQVADRRAGNTLLQGLHEAMAEFAQKLAGPAETPAVQALGANLGEGLGALLLTAEDGIRTGDAEELRLVQQMTAERDSLVDNLRRRVMAAEHGLSGADQELLYGLTSLFERIVWLLRRFTAAAADQAERRASAEA
jgi:phosphate:Na+ symporter